MTQPPTYSIKEHTLPLQLTPFVGRDKELTDVIQLLSEPTCRLLTLTGPGGIGKTRLALEAASRMQDAFHHGVSFVALQAVESPEFLTPAIVDAVGATLSSHDDPHAQLLNYLRGKATLLLLDNLEQLLDGVALLSDILQTAPAVKLLVTSREVLNLQEEWLYPLEGLPYPHDPHEPAIGSYSAVQLFVERARRVRPDFNLERETSGVARLCRMLEGMPLAIELAAAWVKTLRCADIADEIQRGLGFLTRRWRDVPERQRSIQAVFNHSWKLLTGEERSVFKRLAVFRNGFSRQAAEAVAGASIHILSSLVDKSLLRWEIEGRYQIHELLRQYAEEQLERVPEEITRIRDAHCAYYANFLHQRLDDIAGSRQREAIAEIAAEVENIRKAWEWAAERTKADELFKASETLGAFYEFQSRYLEGANAFEKAAQSLAGYPHEHPTAQGAAGTPLANDAPTKQTDLARVSILVSLGWFYIRLGRLDEAEAVLAESRTTYRRLNIPPIPGVATDPLLALSIIASIKGDYTLAQQRADQARQVSEANDHVPNREVAYYALAQALLAQGHYEEARRHVQQAYGLARKINDRWFMAYCLNTLGHLAHASNDLDAAKGYYEASYAIRQEFDDPEGMAVALNCLGEIALQQGAYAEAEQLYRQSHGVYAEINDRGGLATALTGLGNVALVMGNYPVACQQFSQALHIATEMRYAPLILSLLIRIGHLLIHSGQSDRGLELLALVLHHPASDRETQARAEESLTRYRAGLPTELFPPAAQAGQQSDLQAVGEALQRELADLEAANLAIAPETNHTASSLIQPLVEPLTQRELDVLRLIADGRSNREIAEELVIAVGTVKRYTSEIYDKLAVHSRTQAVARAWELELLP